MWAPREHRAPRPIPSRSTTKALVGGALAVTLLAAAACTGDMSANSRGGGPDVATGTDGLADVGGSPNAIEVCDLLDAAQDSVDAMRSLDLAEVTGLEVAVALKSARTALIAALYGVSEARAFRVHVDDVHAVQVLFHKKSRPMLGRLDILERNYKRIYRGLGTGAETVALANMDALMADEQEDLDELFAAVPECSS